MPIKFDLPKEALTIIKVIGVGGGGSNAVNHMFRQGITGVDFIVCNTDQQALNDSPVPVKVQLGATLTEGLGAGAKAEVGKNAAIENLEEIQTLLDKRTKMVFITAGMGGGTGTGAAPVIAKTAKEMGILTVGIVTMPFAFEGKRRKRQADEGVQELRDTVDTLLIINNDKLREMYGNLTLENAFEQADNVLTMAAKGIAETITKTGRINVDFKDIETVMKNSGVALMGSARASGQDRSRRVVEEALACPLLNDNQISGAEHILLNITYGENQVLMDEITEITDYIQDEAGEDAEVIWGHGQDEILQADELAITIIATGFRKSPLITEAIEPERRIKVHTLSDDKPAATPLLRPQPAKTVEKPQQPTLFERTSREPRTVVVPSSFNNEPDEQSAPTTPEESQSDQKSSHFSEIKSGPTPAIPPKETTEAKEIIRHSLDETPTETNLSTKANEKTESDTPFLKNITGENTSTPKVNAALNQPDMSSEERMRIIQERLSRLKNISAQVRTPQGISQLESVPAYKRLAVNLDEVSPSSESPVSRLTLSESEDSSGDKKTDIKSNNSFLHDNVD